MSAASAPVDSRSGLQWTAAVAGFVLMALVGYAYLVAGLVVPGIVVYVLRLGWIALVALQIRYRWRPAIVLGLPFAGLGLLIATATVGDLFFGWSA